MLNKPLHDALRSKLGEVRVTNENQQRVERYDPRSRTSDVKVRGEHYQVCCPFCDDQKYRLSVSYQYLQRKGLTYEKRTSLIHCYNQGCQEVYEDQFAADLTRRVADARVGSLIDDELPEQHVEMPVSQSDRRLPLPPACTLLRELPSDHEARVFLRGKYPGLSERIMLAHNLMWSERSNKRYRFAARRIVFPIYSGGELVSWQGRAIDDDDKLRWYSPPGFVKEHVFNIDSITPIDQAVICEGIPSAIACGLKAVAIYGTSPSQAAINMLAERCQSVVLATDPDTYVPDNRPGGKGKIAVEDLRHRFEGKLRTALITWPSDVLAAARAYCNGETKVKPPDAADLGVRKMKAIIDAAVS